MPPPADGQARRESLMATQHAHAPALHSWPAAAAPAPPCPCRALAFRSTRHQRSCSAAAAKSALLPLVFPGKGVAQRAGAQMPMLHHA
eukprot:1327575-Pleurochrysis_carterae.AAC.3